LDVSKTIGFLGFALILASPIVWSQQSFYLARNVTISQVAPVSNDAVAFSVTVAALPNSAGYCTPAGNGGAGITFYLSSMPSSDANSLQRLYATVIPGIFNPLTDWQGRHMAGWLVFDNKMWIVGGDNNSGHYQSDIWNSTDGAHWTEVTDSPQWALPSAGGGPRVLYDTAVFNNGSSTQIYLIGGQTLPETIGYNVQAIIDSLLLH
jgi:hypothetical protein